MTLGLLAEVSGLGAAAEPATEPTAELLEVVESVGLGAKRPDLIFFDSGVPSLASSGSSALGDPFFSERFRFLRLMVFRFIRMGLWEPWSL